MIVAVWPTINRSRLAEPQRPSPKSSDNLAGSRPAADCMNGRSRAQKMLDIDSPLGYYFNPEVNYFGSKVIIFGSSCSVEGVFMKRVEEVIASSIADANCMVTGTNGGQRSSLTTLLSQPARRPDAGRSSNFAGARA